MTQTAGVAFARVTLDLNPLTRRTQQRWSWIMGEGTTDLVDLVVQDDEPQPVGVYKLIQRASALEITQTQARQLFKAGQQPVIARLPQDRAEGLKVEFEALGATVVLRPTIAAS